MNTKLQSVITLLTVKGARVHVIPETPRQWVKVSGITLESLAGLFPKIQVSTLEEGHFAFPTDTVELPEVVVTIPKPFTVVAVSSNANSFGYKSVVCLAEDGEGFEGLVQAYGTDKVPVRGDVVFKNDTRWYCGTRGLTKAEPSLAKKILADVRKG